MTVVALANSVYNVATSERPVQQAQIEGFSWAGAFMGGIAGANYGKTFGAYGALAGGIGGAIAGGYGVGKGFEIISNNANSVKLNPDTRNLLKSIGATNDDIEWMLTHD